MNSPAAHPPFARDLSGAFLDALIHGPAGVVLRASTARGLDVRLREDYLNAYAAGRSIAKLSWRARRGALLEVHHKYVDGDRLGGVAGTRHGDYVAFDVDDALAAAYRGDLPGILRRAAVHRGPEEQWEALVVRANAADTPLVVLDRQVAFPGAPGRLDVAAVDTTGERPRLVAVEVKRDLDNRIQEVPSQVLAYLELLDPDSAGLRADVATAWSRVCQQMADLGLCAPESALVTPGMPVVGLVVLANYNPRSALLARAHTLAATLPRPVHLCEFDARTGMLPSPADWVTLGIPTVT